MTDEEVKDHILIQQTLARYCRGIDRRDVDLLKSVYHEDSIDDHTDFKGSGWDFAEYIIDICNKMGGPTQHNITNSYIEIDGNSAKVDSYYITHHAFSEENTNEQKLILALGRYLDKFTKVSGEWKILNRLVTIDWSSLIDAPPAFPGASRFPITGSKEVDPMYNLFPHWR